MECGKRSRSVLHDTTLLFSLLPCLCPHAPPHISLSQMLSPRIYYQSPEEREKLCFIFQRDNS